MPDRYQALFEPIQIGGVTIKNRVILTAMGGTAPFGHGDGVFNPKIREYYLDRARGGVGLIIPGVTAVKQGDSYLYENEAVFLGPIKELMDELHALDCKYFLQLGAGFGRAQLFGFNAGTDEETMRRLLVSASDGIPNVWAPSVKHRGLTREEIHDIVRAYGKTAQLCQRAGIDGIEIHAVHEGYLLDQFAVSATNHRNDEYGGSLENRLRFACEIIQEVKRVCGKDFPVSVRYSVTSKMRGFNAGALPGENYMEFGRSLEESPAAARILEAAGADLLNADNGSYDSWWWAHPPVYMPLQCNFPEVSYLKKFVNIPVFCAGRMEDPAFASKAIAAGEIDGIGVARQFLADPYWLQKAREGREEDIRPCIACHNGCFAIGLVRPRPNSQPGVRPNRPFGMSHCALNPVTMDEEKWALKPAEVQKRVAVIGGGIGGMEAARLLSMRGHSVTLFEKSNELGGVFIAAAAPSFKEKDKMLLAWYIHEMEKHHIDLRMNTEATPALLADYDAVIAATGSTARQLSVEGLDDPRVMEAIEYLRGQKAVGERCVIIGGGLTGVEIAYQLVLEGKKPTIVEMQEDILQVTGLCAANSNMLREIIRLYNIPVIVGASLQSITSGEQLTVQLDGAEAVTADNVILSVGYVPETRLVDQLKAAGVKNLHVIGDAREVGNLMSVIYDAYEVAYSI